VAGEEKPGSTGTQCGRRESVVLGSELKGKVSPRGMFRNVKNTYVGFGALKFQGLISPARSAPIERSSSGRHSMLLV